MSTTNTNAQKKPASRPACYSKSQWEKATYDAYMSLIALIKGEINQVTFLKRHSALFASCGVPADGKHMISLLISMAKDTSMEGEKVRKVNSITSLRQFFNRTWADKDALRVAYVEPKKPTEAKKSTTKAKKAPVNEESVTKWVGKMSSEEKAAFIAKLMGEAA